MNHDLLSCDEFALFDLPQDFRLDKTDLRSRYQTLMRTHHPDAVDTNATAMEKLRQQQIATRINTAHDILADPLRRAQCLLTLLGQDAENHKRDLPKAFLIEQLSYREKLDDTTSVSALMAMADDLAQQETTCEETLQQLFAHRNTAHTLSPKEAEAIGLHIRQWQFWRKLAEAIEEKLDH